MSKTDKSHSGFSDEEKKAMQERVRELELAADKGKLKGKARQEKELFDKIAEMPEADRVIAEHIHALVSSVAPDLTPKTMYGMPAYANADGKTVLFFQASSKWETRYSALVFEDPARLDDGTMWPTSFAITELNAENEKRIAELVQKAIRS